MQLRRAAVDDVGKLLWKYHSPEQLVRAMRTALVGMSESSLAVSLRLSSHVDVRMLISHETEHRDLCSLGKLPLDTSPGNILIRLRPDTDIEPRSESEFEGPKTAPNGDDMTVSTSLRVIYAGS